MSVFSQVKRSMGETARRNPLTQAPSSFGEQYNASHAFMYNNMLSFSADALEREEYENYIKQAETITGLRNALQNPKTGATGLEPVMMERFFKRVEDLRRDHPNLPGITQEQVREKVKAKREEARNEYAEVAGKSRGFLQGLGGFLGGATAILRDPPVLMSMLLGAPAGVGILRFMLSEAAIAGVTETAVQTKIQADRDRLGEPIQLGEAAQAVGLATVTGGVGAGLLRGGITGTQALVARSKALPDRLRTREVKAAETHLERMNQMLDTNPFPNTPAGRAEHASRLDAAMLALRDGLVRPDLRASTAVGRVPSGIEPEINIRPLKDIEIDEPIDDYMRRVRSRSPALFRQIEDVDRNLDEIQTALIRNEAELASTSDINKRTKILNERSSILLRRKEVETKQNKLVSRVQNALDKTPRKRIVAKTGVNIPKIIDRIDVPEINQQAGNLARVVERIAKDVDDDTPLTAPRPDDALNGELDAMRRIYFRQLSEEQDVKSAGATAALRRLAREAERSEADQADEFLTSLRSQAEENPDIEIELLDTDTGNLRTVKAGELLDEFSEGDRLLREFEDCIRGIT